MDKPATLRRLALVRALVVLGCALLAWESFSTYRTWQRNRDQLLVVAEQAGLDSPSTRRRLQREINPHHARLEAARGLVFQLLESGGHDVVEARERLAVARRLARTVLARQPNSWQAAMLLGASVYLDWSLARDPRLFTASDAWQEPLLKALREAPREREPRRVLASAYLELWPNLAPARRELARELLRRTFAEDPEAFRLFGRVWLETARDPREALAIVPDQPAAWQQLISGYSAAERYDLVCLSYERYLESLERSLERRLAEGEERLRLGDIFHSRTRFARVVADAPTEERFVPLVNRALTRYPPGLLSAGTDDAMRRWLSWVIELGQIGIFPLDPAIVRRLATATRRLDPPEAAMIALYGDDLAGAERLERLEPNRGVIEWAAYFIVKTQHLLARGEAVAAQQALSEVAAAGRDTPGYWLAARAVARARSDAVALAEAESRLDALRASVWPARAWRQLPQYSLLRIFPERSATGVVIAIAEAAPEGAAVQLRLDGAAVACRPVRPGRTIEVELELSAKPHLLEWLTLGGPPARPGAVTLR